jgi:hypothetical protein
MPVHDWTRVNAGTFHDFHSSWIIHLKEALNGGLLPEGYYAMAEQHLGRWRNADMLRLEMTGRGLAARQAWEQSGSIAGTTTPPKVSRRVVASPSSNYRLARRTLTVRTAPNHRLVAMIEIISPGNKDRPASVREFVEKAYAALRHGCHLLLIDLFPPGSHGPAGLHAAIWEELGAADDDPPWPADKPLTLASYMAAPLPEAFLEPIAVSDVLPEMPLFLQVDGHIAVPLEATYQAAYRGMPAYWRGKLEASGSTR